MSNEYSDDHGHLVGADASLIKAIVRNNVRMFDNLLKDNPCRATGFLLHFALRHGMVEIAELLIKNANYIAYIESHEQQPAARLSDDRSATRRLCTGCEPAALEKDPAGQSVQLAVRVTDDAKTIVEMELRNNPLSYQTVRPELPKDLLFP